MPFSIGYAPSALTSTDIGYTTGPLPTTVASGVFGDTQNNLAFIDLPIAGVYLVEGQARAAIFNVAEFFYLSLATTNNVVDYKRFSVFWMGNMDLPDDINSQGHMSSVFSVTGPTRIYMIGRIRNGTSGFTTVYMTYTRLG